MALCEGNVRFTISCWGRIRKPLEKIVTEWRQTIDAIEWPILSLDTDRRITRLNRAAQRLAGLEFHQLLRRPVESVGAWPPWREIGEMARAVAETRASLSRPVSGQRGEAWHVSATYSPGPLRSGDRIIVVARDVTERARLETQLRRAETMAAMGVLVSGVAHEVRNPLFAISATVDALEARFHGHAGLAPFVITLRREVERLRRLMRDLLDYGKPPALELAWVDAGEIVASAVRACEPIAMERKVRVENAVSPGLARPFLDPGRAVQAVQNLLENAIHHSPPGGMVDVAGAISSRDGRDWLEIRVRDRGPGFAPEDLARVFEPFFTRRRGGTGLGLSIVRRIAEAHGGAVEAANAPGGGAVLTLTLPLSPPPHRDARAGDVVPPPPASEV